MSTDHVETRTERFNTIFTALADRQRRLVLDVLDERAAPVDERALATQLAAHRRGVEPEAVTDDDRQRALLALRHEVLPVLEEARLVDRRSAGLTTAQHAVADHPVIQRVLDAVPPDDVLVALANGRRRDVCAILAGRESAMDRRALATRLVAREYDVALEDVPDREVDDVLTTLHHVHLPTLEDADVLEYDHERGLVTYVGHPTLAEDHLDADEHAPVVVTSA